MTPTLLGRIHTRCVLMFAVGLPLTVALFPWLPGDPPFSTLLMVLATVLLLGIVVWEFLYHLLQQFRWEKDWPLIFGLLTAVNEGVLAFVVLRSTGVDVAVRPFVIHFGAVWVAIWAMAAGPMRVLSLRWRYQGGRVW